MLSGGQKKVLSYLSGARPGRPEVKGVFTTAGIPKSHKARALDRMLAKWQGELTPQDVDQLVKKLRREV
jgi:hypothetical protein